MKRIKQVLIILLLAETAVLNASELGIELENQPTSQPAAHHTITLFIRDLNSDKVVTNVPLQATYGGFFVSSNHNGQIILPRKTENPEFYLMITPTIAPSISILNNVSHLIIPNQNPVVMYHLELQDQNWITTQVTIPDNRQVPLQAIVILTEPENVTLKEGRSPILLNKHLVLPSIYLTKEVNDQNSLAIPDSRPFLANLKTAYALTPYGYATIQIP